MKNDLIEVLSCLFTTLQRTWKNSGNGTPSDLHKLGADCGG